MYLYLLPESRVSFNLGMVGDKEQGRMGRKDYNRADNYPKDIFSPVERFVSFLYEHSALPWKPQRKQYLADHDLMQLGGML